jgi:hypothetical protein
MDFSPFSFVRQSMDALCRAAKQYLRRWTRPDSHDLVLNAAMDLTRSKQELLLENLLLRQQLIVLKRQVKRPALTWRDRALFVLLASKLPTWKAALAIVQPDTLLRWHRDLSRWVWSRNSKPRQRRGRSPLTGEIVAVIKRIVKENRTWGAERVRGQLLNLGVRVSKSTLQKHMNEVRTPRSPRQT